MTSIIFMSSFLCNGILGNQKKELNTAVYYKLDEKLKGVMLSKTSQRKKDKYWMMSPLYYTESKIRE